MQTKIDFKQLSKKFKQLNPKALVIFGLAVIVATSISTYIYASGLSNKNTELKDESDFSPEVLAAQDITPITEESIEDINTLDVLLLGYGGAGHSGGYLTDVIQVVHFDFDKLKISFISIPRDLWVTIPSGSETKSQSSKINKAFTMGGADTTAQMVSNVTGLKIDKFISIDFVGFKRAIGYVLEGITVDVPEALDDPWYPISGREQDVCGKSPEEVASLTNQYSGFKLESQFECRYEHIHFDKGINKMEGGDALAYVRSRHGSAGGDFSRSERQQALLIAIKDKLFKLEVLKNIPAFFKAMIAHTDTNFDIESIKYLAPLLTKSNDFEISSITLSTSNVFKNSKSSSGQYIVVPKNGNNSWSDVRDYVRVELDK